MITQTKSVAKVKRLLVPPRLNATAPSFAKSRHGAGHALAQQIDQRWLHVGVLIRNAKAHHALAAQRGAEPAGGFGAVRGFHEEDDVRPGDQVGIQQRIGVGRDAGGLGLDVRRGEDFFRRRAAQAIAAADEKEMNRRGRIGDRDCRKERAETVPDRQPAWPIFCKIVCFLADTALPARYKEQ